MNDIYEYALRKATISGALDGLTDKERELYICELMSDIIWEREFSEQTARCCNAA